MDFFLLKCYLFCEILHTGHSTPDTTYANIDRNEILVKSTQDVGIFWQFLRIYFRELKEN